LEEGWSKLLKLAGRFICIVLVRKRESPAPRFHPVNISAVRTTTEFQVVFQIVRSNLAAIIAA